MEIAAAKGSAFILQAQLFALEIHARVEYMGSLHLQLIAEALLGLTLLTLLVYAVLILCHKILYLRKKNNSLDLTEEFLNTCESRYRLVMAQAPVILSAIDVKGNFLFSEGRGLETLETGFDHRMGHSAFDAYQNYPTIITDIQRALAGETLRSRHDIGAHTFETLLTPMCDVKGHIIGAVAVGTDVTERVQAERALWHQVYYDALTDLPNQTLLQERFIQELQTNRRDKLALLMLDLNHFQEVNDTFGHQQGDLILQQVGKRLSDVFDPSTTIARSRGDEFVILLSGVCEEEAMEATFTISQAFEQPFFIQEFPMHIEASMGIALTSSTHETNFSVLLRQADVAMYIAKQKHKLSVFYQPELDPYTPRRLGLLGALRAAIADGELALFYQPQVDLQTGITDSVEALIRWHHPEYGCVPPDQFIPLAEQTGLIQPLTEWVLEAAIQQCAEWLQKGIQLSVSINLSARNLREADLPDRIAFLLDYYTLPARYVCIEVTESAVMTDIEQGVEILDQISEMGIRVAVDDFGTGYSSLAYLRSLPVNELKIDRLFVSQMLADRIDATIVHSTIGMARDLGLKVVAEGVEDQRTADLLAGYGCDCAQGYYWSRPIPSQELLVWLQKTKAVVIV